jgi:hypothetical protein
VTVINDWNLNDEDLQRYRVLILPNTACLDAAQVAAIERFVSGGGGLVASLDTSLFDEFGNAREDFALKSVLGVSHRGVAEAPSVIAESNAAAQTADVTQQIDVNFAKAITPDYWERRKNVFDFKLKSGSTVDTARLQSYIGSDPVTFKGPSVVVVPTAENAQIAATAVIKGNAAESEFPAIVTRQHGRGRVVYFAAGIDSAYYAYAYPYQRVVLKEAIEWAASAGAPLEVTAPMCVHATFMRQNKGERERLVVHLYNDVNTTAHHALPIDDVPLREEVLPIHNIQIQFDGKYPILSVYQQPEGVKLETVTAPDGRLSVTVPKLDVHTMVVAELEAPGSQTKP